jgi:hypothetical protein
MLLDVPKHYRHGQGTGKAVIEPILLIRSEIKDRELLFLGLEANSLFLQVPPRLGRLTHYSKAIFVSALLLNPRLVHAGYSQGKVKYLTHSLGGEASSS